MNIEPELPEFNTIRVVGKCQLLIQKGESPEVSISSKRSGIDTKFEVRDNELLIDAIPFNDNGSDRPLPKITITYTKIRSIILTGAIDLYTCNKITGHTFSLILNGTGNVVLTVEVENLDCTIVKAGTIRVFGNAVNSLIMLLGAGNYQMLPLKNS
ncbi:GIN domain-containing protein [Pedobacter caeni]|uniref:Putative auto-transporter adhesin, head GIN domain n=1 Tax=Pedobacter caeni TaxID=288992 RepID=A0A1M4T8I1_9SPHI|nr:DUF2807 domain-containing protein [Pedobacter caeni]SHE40684.1 Putative auto-transporter adhesin, head GIN domain [Pedobacter caeni]